MLSKLYTTLRLYELHPGAWSWALGIEECFRAECTSLVKGIMYSSKILPAVKELQHRTGICWTCNFHHIFSNKMSSSRNHGLFTCFYHRESPTTNIHRVTDVLGIHLVGSRTPQRHSSLEEAFNRNSSTIFFHFIIFVCGSSFLSLLYLLTYIYIIYFVCSSNDLMIRNMATSSTLVV